MWNDITNKISCTPIITIHIIMSNSQLWLFCKGKGNELLQKRAAETAGLVAAFWPPGTLNLFIYLFCDLQQHRWAIRAGLA